jgi:hypothetical protein
LKKLSPTLSVTLILSVSFCIASRGEQASDKSNSKERSIFCKIPVWISSHHSNPENFLRIEDFKVLNGRTPVKITSLQDPQSPMLLFLAFDTVGDLNRINEARNGVIAALDALGNQYWVGLISAQEQLSVLQEPTPDRELLKQRIRELTQIGRAGLLESFQPIADLTTSILLKTEVRVAVVFVTDSDIANYRADYLNPPVNVSDSRDLSRRFAGRALQERISRMSASLARYRAPIFIVHIDPGSDSLNRSYHNGLKQLAESIGGQCFLSKTLSDIEPTIRLAFRWAQSFYLLGFNVSGQHSGFRRIQVLISNPEPNTTSVPRLTYSGRIFFP